MLARANRLVSGDDYRAAVRRGRRAQGRVTICYFRRTEESRPIRFGFIVAKSVGIAVVRNRVRRRLKAACRESLSTLPGGYDIVVRALPSAADAPWTTLQEDIRRALDRIGTP